jgi:hypothetical protein
MGPRPGENRHPLAPCGPSKQTDSHRASHQLRRLGDQQCCSADPSKLCAEVRAQAYISRYALPPHRGPAYEATRNGPHAAGVCTGGTDRTARPRRRQPPATRQCSVHRRAPRELSCLRIAWERWRRSLGLRFAPPGLTRLALSVAIGAYERGSCGTLLLCRGNDDCNYDRYISVHSARAGAPRRTGRSVGRFRCSDEPVGTSRVR